MHAGTGDVEIGQGVRLQPVSRMQSDSDPAMHRNSIEVRIATYFRGGVLVMISGCMSWMASV